MAADDLALWIDPSFAASSQPAGRPEDDRIIRTATAAPRLVEWLDYSGGLEERPALTGDWGGVRQKLMDDGVRLNLNWTQTLQGNVAGGASKTLFYQGGVRYEIELDTGAVKLWPGGMFHLRGETQYGETDLMNSGALTPVNTDALFPEPDENSTGLTEAYYKQFLAEWIGGIIGKISPRERVVFAHDETTQFFNSAFIFDPVYATTVPLDFLGAGVIVEPAPWFNLETFVIDSEGTGGNCGFDTVFEGGTTVVQAAQFSIEPCELPGHQRIGWSWSDKLRIKLGEATPQTITDIVFRRTSSGPLLSSEGSDWSIFYNFDQYLYLKPDTKDQGFGLFGRFGVGDENINPAALFYSLGAGGKGIIPGRDEDTFGVGYYFLMVSDDLNPVLKQFIGDEEGVEVWYNIAIAPWWHLTPDIQVIQPGRSTLDTAVVLGLRMRLDF